MVQAHDHVGCEPCLDALIDLEARVDALEQPDRARRRDEAYRAMVEALSSVKADPSLVALSTIVDDALALARQAEEA